MRKLLLSIFPIFLALSIFGANPPYEAFLGTNGIVITSNPPNGKIIVDGNALTNSLPHGLTTNFNQFLGVPLSIKDSALMTNIFLYQITSNSGVIASRVLTLPTTSGLGVFNGSNQWYSTNLTADTTIVLTNLLEGADYFLQVSNPASFNVTFTSIGNESWIEHPYVAGAATTNGITLFKFQRWGVKTNAFDLGRNLTLTNDDGSITFQTNNTMLIIRATAGTGGVGFGDLVWTNASGDIQVVPTITTNIHFSVDGSLRVGPEVTNGAVIDISDPSVKSITVNRPNANSTIQTDDNGFAIGGVVAAFEGGFTRFDVFGSGSVAGGNSSIDLGLQIGGRYVVHFDPTFAVGPTSYIFSSANRVTNTDTLLSLQNSNAPMFEVNGIGDLKLLKSVAYSWPASQGAAGTVLTNNGSGALGWGYASNNFGPPASFAGTTNFFNLSVQSAKLPFTNYPSIDGGWPAWETVYAETNAEGNRATLGANWQFMVPTDYATNSLKLLVNYSLLNTNGPNTSNVVWGASVLVIRSGTTNNVHTNLFGPVLKGSNDWIAKYDGTNICTNIVLDLGTNSQLLARDLCILKVERYPTEDTYGGAVALHGLQIEYTRP